MRRSPVSPGLQAGGPGPIGMSEKHIDSAAAARRAMTAHRRRVTGLCVVAFAMLAGAAAVALLHLLAVVLAPSGATSSDPDTFAIVYSAIGELPSTRSDR